MKVLVLVDGLHSHEVLDTLGRIIRLETADVILVYVRGHAARAGLDMIVRRPGAGALPPDRERELTHAEHSASAGAIAEAEAAARDRACSVEGIEVTGDPGRSICELAVQRNADLIAVRAGGRDRPPMGPHSLGPTARYITDHSTVPVLLLRA